MSVFSESQLVTKFNLKDLQLWAPTSDHRDESCKGLVDWKWEADCQSLKVFIEDAIQGYKNARDPFHTVIELHFIFV